MEKTIRATIPVADLARESLDQIFPHLTPDQVAAIRDGKPVPPSPDWLPPGSGPASAPPVAPQVARRAAYLGGDYADHMLTYFAGKALARMPKVVCTLVFGQRERLKMARKAVNQFVAQRYPNKAIVIINGTDLPITTVPHAAIKEIKVQPHLTVAEMRTMALEEAVKIEGCEWIKPCWDDDDIYDPHLLSYMMTVAQTEGHKPLLLRYQARVNINTGTVFVLDAVEGVPNSMLVPAIMLAETREYPSDADDSEFLMAGVKRLGLESHSVVNNAGFPFNLLSGCVFHGHNFMPVERLMGERADPEHDHKWFLTVPETEHMKRVLASFGFNIEVKAEVRA